MTTFVDSSAFYAAADTTDVDHDRAATILATAERLVTTTAVLAESWALLNLRLGRGAAQSFWSAVRNGAAEVAVLGVADIERAWHVGDAFPDQDFSLVDMTSFVVMERLGLTRVATFDHHFSVYRYGPRRDRAFEIAG
jgi:predicted nucleic acid-binding protein